MIYLKGKKVNNLKLKSGKKIKKRSKIEWFDLNKNIFKPWTKYKFFEVKKLMVIKVNELIMHIKILIRWRKKKE